MDKWYSAGAGANDIAVGLVSSGAGYSRAPRMVGSGCRAFAGKSTIFRCNSGRIR